MLNALPEPKAHNPRPVKDATHPELPLTKPVNDPLIRELIEMLPSILHQNFSAEELALPFKLSYTRIRYRFKAATGVSLWYYVKWLRLEKARQLLGQGQFTVKEVMARVGLRDKDNFRRDFRKAYGLTPRAYREWYGQNTMGH
jgi:transcriptional regulator GlxA family with amidase domain